MPDFAPFSLPFFSSTSSISAATFVSTSSSRSYLLETFLDLTSPLLRPLLRRGFDGVVQSAMPSTRLDSPLRSILRSGEGVFHLSMPCGCDVRQARRHRVNMSTRL